MTEQAGVVRSADGRPAVGIAVSDGYGVTVTDSDGRFALPGSGPFVFVTRPAGTDCERWYMPPRTDADLEFILDSPERAPSGCKFAHITDLHLSVGGQQLTDPDDDALFRFVDGEMLRRNVAPPHAAAPLASALARASLDFVVATGDVTNRGRDEEYAAYLDFVRAARHPVYTVPGNHDLMPQPGDDPLGGRNQQLDQAAYGVVTDRYERYLGPRWYSFDRGDVHFVVLDWYTLYLGLDPIPFS